jgi:hypothetical protein
MTGRYEYNYSDASDHLIVSISTRESIPTSGSVDVLMLEIYDVLSLKFNLNTDSRV